MAKTRLADRLVHQEIRTWPIPQIESIVRHFLQLFPIASNITFQRRGIDELIFNQEINYFAVLCTY